MCVCVLAPSLARSLAGSLGCSIFLFRRATLQRQKCGEGAAVNFAKTPRSSLTQGLELNNRGRRGPGPSQTEISALYIEIYI